MKFTSKDVRSGIMLAIAVACFTHLFGWLFAIGITSLVDGAIVLFFAYAERYGYAGSERKRAEPKWYE